jgi:hypothetical protein
MTALPLRVYADGGGVAYAVVVNLNAPSVFVGPVECGVIRYIREGKPQEIELPGTLILHQQQQFVGSLDIGFTDAFGSRHDAWQPINAASGPVKITDRLHWRCKKCRVHPTDEPRQRR